MGEDVTDCLVEKTVTACLVEVFVDGMSSRSSAVDGSNRKAMNRNWANQKANPALKGKTGINITNRQNMRDFV